ncbi:MAG: hypothetical protein Q8S27_20725 [Hoeflea sp.]|uniref:hypothetical protein n=1 Tax=Hoeflea sp. TaxID=1940281 RepID=UPI00272F5CF3|nr:hypothetical protein [Hoeflea sp.]MDP2120955.1 hypothetical protein [Hoeflea sp.]MDP3527006.1 hypothetical protein [Hoeflea sp.]MDZ7602817.1 hypothetical protein [Hoeflea sp.]
MPTHSRSIVLSAALLIAFSASAHAQSSDPAWLDNLSSQLAVQEDCAVEYYLNIREGNLAGRLTFEARAQCADGRQFDGSLIEPAEEFTISECGVQVC